MSRRNSIYAEGSRFSMLMLALHLIVTVRPCDTESIGGVQLRVTQIGLETVGKRLLKEKNNFFDALNKRTISAKSGDTTFHFSQITVEHVQKKEFAITLPATNTFLLDLTLDMVFNSRVYIDESKDSNQYNFEIRDISLSSSGNIQDIHGTGPLTISACNFTYRYLSGNWMQLLPSEIDDANTVFRDILRELLCPVAKTRFTEIVGNAFGFSDSFDISQKLFPWATQIITREIKNQLYLATYKLRVQESDSHILNLYEENGTHSFPALTDGPDDESKQLYIWFDEDFFSEIERAATNSNLKYVDTILGLTRKIKVEDLFMFPELMDIFEGGFIDFYARNLSIQLQIEPSALNMFVSSSIDVVAIMECPHTTWETHILSINVELNVPVQLGVNDSMLTLGFMNFGGNLTIWNSSIGNLSILQDRQLKDLLYFLPWIYGEKYAKKLNKLMKGVNINNILHDGMQLKNVNVSLEKGYVILGANIRDVNDSTDVQSEMQWIGYYNMKDHHIAFVDHTKNAASIGKQSCYISGSNVNRLTLFFVMGFFVSIKFS